MSIKPFDPRSHLGLPNIPPLLNWMDAPSVSPDLTSTANTHELHHSARLPVKSLPQDPGVVMSEPAPLLPDIPSIPESAQAMEATHLNQLQRTRRWFDHGFWQIYVITMVTFLVTGLYVFFTTYSTTLTPGRENLLFVNFKDAIGLIFFLTVVSTGLGILWLISLRYYAEKLVWVTIILVPVVSFFTSFAVISYAATTSSAHDTITFQTSYLIGALVSFAIGTAQSVYIARRREQIHRAMKAVNLACSVLTSHPELFALAILLLSAYVLFLVVWLIFFSRVILLIPFFPGTPYNLAMPVVLLGLFYCFVFTWTTSIFTNLLRITIAMVVAQWYFYRHEDERLGISGCTQAAFHLAVSDFKGSICLGGLVLAVAQLVGGATHYLLLILRPLRMFPFTLIAWLFRLLEKLLETLSSFTVVYVGVTGKGFFTSAYAVSNLMKRNYVFSVRSALVIGNLLSVTSTTLALTTGWTRSYISFSDFHMKYPYLPGVFGVAISWIIFQFFGHILVNTIEATLVCYAVDLDTRTVHSNEAQRAFEDPAFDRLSIQPTTRLNISLAFRFPFPSRALLVH
ncbi:plasma-membrane choline transporter-domain-containing protein [Dimargaris cristalligena]|uniref:Protein PNS1 n=1 Tax=Dimargaris cristalligena TaxID=215637 RepID=A0A4P9ZR44_9FUNG|nr:plasma-membrane choline transporter-domain-containing protein [Dimargaris cristalligena]|eukprot:RKP35976.1 plasma-membrane choline transporter-domain-containing protein [Dimargaris cristalligena]